MVAKALHLESFVTLARSFARRRGLKTSNNATARRNINVSTVKSSHRGFKKIHEGQDNELEAGWKRDPAIKVKITRTLEINVEDTTREEA
jgi:hypothetical protein